MDFRTEIKIESFDTLIYPGSKINMIGSCFANHIGNRMEHSGLDVHVNPFGVLYNPESIATACRMMTGNFTFESDGFVESEGLWNSWFNDSSFAAPDVVTCKRNLEQACCSETERLKHLDFLFITLGTNRCYALKEKGFIVGNCHKQPAQMFEEKKLTVSQMVVSLQQAMDDLWRLAPSLRVVFTVSPYRYAKYGFHESQLSKAALLLAVDEICSRNDGRCVYFPAYEIVMDELRDYRFYADDMLHPSEMAVNYIWERFTEKCFAKETLNYMKEWERIEKSFTHRPLHPASEAYELFMKSTRMKLRELVDRYPAILNTPAYAKLKDYKI